MEKEKGYLLLGSSGLEDSRFSYFMDWFMMFFPSSKEFNPFNWDPGSHLEENCPRTFWFLLVEKPLPFERGEAMSSQYTPIHLK